MIVLLLVTGAAHAGDFELCINGVNLQGRACTGLGGGTGGMRNQQIVAVGYDAMEIIQHSERMTSGIDGAGRSHFVGPYRGNRFMKLRGQTFSCHLRTQLDVINFRTIFISQVNFSLCLNGWC